MEEHQERAARESSTRERVVVFECERERWRRGAAAMTAVKAVKGARRVAASAALA